MNVDCLVLRLQMSSSVRTVGLSFRGTATYTSLTERCGWTQSSAAGTWTHTWSASSRRRSNTLSTVSASCVFVSTEMETREGMKKYVFNTFVSHSKRTGLPVDRAERQDGTERLPLDRRNPAGESGHHKQLQTKVALGQVAYSTITQRCKMTTRRCKLKTKRCKEI